jgi:hypothetical protein
MFVLAQFRRKPFVGGERFAPINCFLRDVQRILPNTIAYSNQLKYIWWFNISQTCPAVCEGTPEKCSW